jgi:hypothetical protein
MNNKTEPRILPGFMELLPKDQLLLLLGLVTARGGTFI